MAKVTGIDGVFFKAENPQLLTDWYVDTRRSDVVRQPMLSLRWPEP